MAAPTFDAMRPIYATAWRNMAVLPDKLAAATARARKLIANKARYQKVAIVIGCPWFFIACLHEREASANFATHLHNGDPLSGYTYHVPAGRPKVGHGPPFTWEESAIDALQMRGLDRVHDWGVERFAFESEAYNGWGYRNHGVPSAYLWSFSNQYKGGKYVADGVWSPTAMDAQCGVMVLLKAMQAIDPTVAFGPVQTIPQPDVPKPVSPPPAPPIARHVTVWGTIATAAAGAAHWLGAHPLVIVAIIISAVVLAVWSRPK